MRPLRTLCCCAALAAAPAYAGTRQATCSYWSLAGASFEGTCSVESGTDAAGAYSETVRAGATTIRLVETGRQGVWSTYMIDGQPGVRYEHNRESFSYSTLSLDMSLDIGTAAE